MPSNFRLGRGLDALLPQKTLSSADGVKTFLEVSVDEITINPNQPRKNFAQEELKSLSESIKVYGVLEPILLSERPGGGYMLLAGERRWRASKLASLKTVPAIVKNVAKKEARFIGLIENVQRKDLNSIELAQSVEVLASEFNLTHEEIAFSLGFSRPRLTNLLRLLQLSDEIKEYVVQGHLSEGQARALLGIEDEVERAALAKKIAQEEYQISVRDLERKKKSKRKDPNIVHSEEELARILKTQVRITHNPRKKSGWIAINYSGLEHFENLFKRILSAGK